MTLKVPQGKDQKLPSPSKWKSLKFMYKKRLLCLLHKAYYKNCPEQIKNTKEKCTNIRNMRENIKLRVSRPSTEFGRLSFKHRSAMEWNCLPETLKRIGNYRNIKE